MRQRAENPRRVSVPDLTLTDVYIGFELSVVPVYQSEIVPAPVRGFIVGTYQLSINVGLPCSYFGINQ